MMKKYTLSNKRNVPKTRRKILIVCIIIIALAGLAFGLYSLNKDDNTTETSARTSSEKGETSSEKSSGSNTSSGSSSSGSPTGQDNDTGGDKEGGSTTPAPSNTPPATPSGTFISNHHPNLSGSPAPNKVQSTCVTTPGAKCNIVFTKGGVTKSLGEQTADADGAVYWQWTLQDKGLTEGSWKVTAVATLNGQTASTGDPINLEVKQ